MRKSTLLRLSVLLLSIISPALAFEIREPYKKIKDSSIYLNKKCIRVEQKEEYVPGTYFSPGYVKYWKEHIQIKCPKRFQSQTCFINKYNEEYIPGTNKSPGHVKYWNQEIRIPCAEENSNDEIPKKLINKSKRNGLL